MLLPLKQGIATLLLPLVFESGFLPSRDTLSPFVNIPNAIRDFIPLPEEALVNSYSLANSYLTMGNYEDAYTMVRNAEMAAEKGNKGEIVELFVTKGIVEEKLLLWKQAIGDYEKAISLEKAKNPFANSATIVSNLANAEAGYGDYKQALSDFRKASKMNGNAEFFAPVIGEALTLYQLDQVKEALNVFNSILVKYPSYSDSLAAVGVIEGDLHKFNNAIAIDGRYADIQWVREIRRWTPKLCDKLEERLDSWKGQIEGTSS
jgi:tetratricopeptide (TPR) repeat protein